MVRTWFLALAAGLIIHAAAPVQAAWRLHSRPGQVLSYSVAQVTSATEVIGGNKTTTTTKLNLVKHWQNLGPEKGKPGTKMALSLTALRIETTKASGETLLFDSANLEQSTPEMRESLTKLIGRTLAVVRIDGSGQVLEVIESKHSPASRFESEPPFVLVLPNLVPQVGTKWSRHYRITLEPPLGTREKYDATQQYECKAIEKGKAAIALKTRITKPPESLLDRVPLLQMQPEGEVIFDIETGRLHSANLRIDKELKNHQGEGSSYRFQSVYREKYVGGR
jgi:hypothetical protein